MTFHPRGRTTSATWFNDREWLDFNMFQSGHRRYGQRNGDGDWENIRYDLDMRPVEGINGESRTEEILAVLKNYGISKDGVELWGTGTPLREFLWSEEMADASVFIMEHVDFKDTYRPGTKEIRNCHINIGTGKEITIRQLAELIVDTVGYQGKLTFDSTIQHTCIMTGHLDIGMP